jgi:hypothetical protein
MSYYGKLILMNNNTIFVILLLASTFLTSTLTMLPAAHAGGGEDDDHDKRGDSNKQRVEEDGAGAIADCDWNDIEESDFRCNAAAAADEGIKRDGGTISLSSLPIVLGEGSVESVVCDPSAPIPAPGSITFQAVLFLESGFYKFSNGQEGGITGGTTDGTQYSLSGEGQTVCRPADVVEETTISGDCGDDVTITYEDPSTVATFTGDVDCRFL